MERIKQFLILVETLFKLGYFYYTWVMLVEVPLVPGQGWIVEHDT